MKITYDKSMRENVSAPKELANVYVDKLWQGGIMIGSMLINGGSITYARML